jgi:hypothetical protein
MVRYRSRRPPEVELRTRLRDLANQRRRFGYRRLFILLREQSPLDESSVAGQDEVRIFPVLEFFSCAKRRRTGPRKMPAENWRPNCRHAASNSRSCGLAENFTARKTQTVPMTGPDGVVRLEC